MQKLKQNRKTGATGAVSQAPTIAPAGAESSELDSLSHGTHPRRIRQNEHLHARARSIARRRLATASDPWTRTIRGLAVALLESSEEEGG